MKISLNHISKRFQKHWIFKEISFDFLSPGSYALLGPNGSGKSTLLRIIAGMQAVSKGTVQHYYSDKQINADHVFRHVSFTAPGQEIIEELTMREFLEFHFSFKKPLPGLDINTMIAASGLQASANKPIGDYSSGMKQRVKLVQAIFTDTPVLLLDEPCTNLDQEGVSQYRNWMVQYASKRLVIIASNDQREYEGCKQVLRLEDYK
jgi:ABC-type multidrug transport system ATPase subunit